MRGVIAAVRLPLPRQSSCGCRFFAHHLTDNKLIVGIIYQNLLFYANSFLLQQAIRNYCPSILSKTVAYHLQIKQFHSYQNTKIT